MINCENLILTASRQNENKFVLSILYKTKILCAPTCIVYIFVSFGVHQRMLYHSRLNIYLAGYGCTQAATRTQRPLTPRDTNAKNDSLI